MGNLDSIGRQPCIKQNISPQKRPITKKSGNNNDEDKFRPENFKQRNEIKKKITFTIREQINLIILNSNLFFISTFIFELFLFNKLTFIFIINNSFHLDKDCDSQVRKFLHILLLGVLLHTQRKKTIYHHPIPA